METPRNELVRLILSLDHDGIESARGAVQPGDVPPLTTWYFTLSDWRQKMALVDLIRDQHHPSMEAVLIDALRAPGRGDWVELTKAFALGWLSDELDNFMGYYNDRGLLVRTVDAFLAGRGLECERGIETAAAKPPPPSAPELPNDPTERLLASIASGLNDEVRVLLARGVSPDTQSSTGDPALCVALMKKNFDAAMMLVQAGANPDARRATASQPALWWAASQGAEQVVDALLRAGAAVDAKNKWGSTALTVASTDGHLQVVRRLISAGANVRNQISDGRSVLNLAMRSGKPEVLRSLVEAGADLQSPQPSFTPLAMACFEGNAAMVKLLLDLGAKPDTRFSGSGFKSATALMVAARGGKLSMVKHLLAAGASPAIRDTEGATAADMAKGRRAEEIRAVLNS